MRNLEKYKGVFPAFYACYDDDGEISTERTQRFADYLVGKGVKGLYLTGSSGECIYQTVEERKRIVESVMEAVGGRATIIAHIAAPSTRHSVELAQHAEKHGVDAIASIPPIYFKLPEYAVADYWTAMADSTDLDFVIYNIPQTTGFSLSVGLFREMMKNPKVIGVKNSSMPVLDIQQFREAAGDSAVIFNGPDEQFVAGRLMGADSGIGGTYGVMPELFLKADELICAGRYGEAAQIQNAVNAIIMDMCSLHGNLYAVMKAILKIKGMDIGGARPPLPPVSDGDLSHIDRIARNIEDAIQTFCG